MPKTIADLAAGTISATTQLEVQNGSDGQKITGQDLVDFVGANVSAVRQIISGNSSVSGGATTIIGSFLNGGNKVMALQLTNPTATVGQAPFMSSKSGTSVTINGGNEGAPTYYQIVEFL
jgi:hypothetical protein